MVPFQWNALFETGNARIDRQHRTLFELTNDLARAVQNGEKLPEISALVIKLRDYAATHFCDEEQLMRCSALPIQEKTRHACAHRSFIRKVEELASRSDLSNVEAVSEFLQFLVTWLVTHILKLDHRMTKALLRDHAPDAERRITVEQILISALMETERRFRVISDEAPTLIWICGIDGVRDFANKAWFDLVGATGAEGGPVDWTNYLHPEDKERYPALIAGLMDAPLQVETEFRVRGAAGDWRWILEKITPRMDGERPIGLIASGIDITDIKLSEGLVNEANSRMEQQVAERTREFQRLAHADPLTGIANRRLLIDRLDSEVARAARCGEALSVLYVDIDYFKSINDTFGHAAGDSVLVELAATMKGLVRQTDLVARMGGEEFVVLLLNTEQSAALRAADHLREAIARCRFAPITRPVTVSVGVAGHQAGEDAAQLLARADHALLQAKRSGRNQCILARAEVGALAVLPA
ncbi:diguanylate cyclase (GGDEF)-like protein/hemerythrin-like metal-binding protein/PAS domain S-box-containing protein [Rhodopseudomonas rhenobacensis]|uniref:diguanylate cyclase n=1 Tax=Rhodopseudomonas rhenobacensis TaxID=87461 RepID=A0A7W7Z563_9BRAD|nr:bacteriohemerythrin [Rhodopseudomonas rhenobacensis]MBB5048164.1 diguanylate cyclase (GGDEF)-like protein/hemerythrin-like metal-binding protein/PAS domain S-box-containing protein [Rhodopseudomonas rhenobacensis]